MSGSMRQFWFDHFCAGDRAVIADFIGTGPQDCLPLLETLGLPRVAGINHESAENRVFGFGEVVIKLFRPAPCRWQATLAPTARPPPAPMPAAPQPPSGSDGGDGSSNAYSGATSGNGDGAGLVPTAGIHYGNGGGTEPGAGGGAAGWITLRYLDGYSATGSITPATSTDCASSTSM